MVSRQQSSAAQDTCVARSASADMDRKLLSGLAWTGMFRWSGQLVSWASTIIVARLLTPSDYGIFAMAGVVMALLRLLVDSGAASAVLCVGDLEESDLAQMHGFSIVSGLSVCLLAIALSYPASLYFGNPAVAPVLASLSLSLAIGCFRSVPCVLLVKGLRFKRVAVIDAVQVVVIAVLNVVLALLGFGYWTLVIGNITASALSTTITLWFHPHAFAWPRVRWLKRYLPVMRDMVLQRFAWWVNTSSDMMVAGRLLDTHLAGAYGVAFTLADAPIQKLNGILTRVTPGIVSAARHDNVALRRYVLNMTQALAILLFPVTVGVALVAPEFVAVVLGPKWHTAVAPLRILSAYAAFRCLPQVYPLILNVREASNYLMRVTMLTAIVSPGAFYIGSHYGPAGVAFAWICIHPLTTLPIAVKTFRSLELKVADYLSYVAPAIVSCGAMIVAVLGVSALPIPAAHPIIPLAVKSGVGAIVYVGTLLTFFRPSIGVFVRAIQTFRRGDQNTTVVGSPAGSVTLLG